MQVTFDSRRKSLATLERAHPGARFIDVTSKAEMPWVRLSPFYPHGGLPVPFSPGVTAVSVEGIWQGLKVFERADVDPARFEITSMKGIKRSVRVNGRVRGHRKGVEGTELLDYISARHLIYLPSYRYVLEHLVQDLLLQLRALAAEVSLVLLDYETNGDVRRLDKPLSHAALVAMYLRGAWPEA